MWFKIFDFNISSICKSIKQIVFTQILKAQLFVATLIAFSLITGFSGERIIAAELSTSTDLKIIGYIQGASVKSDTLSDMKLEQLTHLIYSHVDIASSSDPTLVSGWGWSYIEKCVNAGHAKGIKVLISLEPQYTYETILNSNTLRAKLVNNIATMLRTYNADGIDIDWEFGANHQEAISRLVTDLYAVLHPQGKMITIAASYEQFDVSLPAAEYVDYINLMTYYFSNFHHIPINGMWTDTIATMNAWANAGYPKEKLMMGFPFYAVDWDGSNQHEIARYCDVIDALNPSDDKNSANVSTIVNWTENPVSVSRGTLYWNGIDMAKQKVDWVKENGYGGMMIWDVGQDKLNDDRSLLKAIYDQMNLIPAPEPAYVEIAPASSTSASGQIQSLSFSSFSAADANAIQEVNTPLVPEGGKLQYVAKGYDAENNPISGLNYTWKVTDPTAGSITSNGVFTAGPNLGRFTGVIQATTPGGMTGTASVTVVESPLVSIGNQSVDEGQLLQFKVSKDQDNSGLTFSASNLPVGSDFDASTQIFSWTPTSSQASTYSVIFQATDGTYIDSESISIIVNNTNSAPVMNSIGNKTAKISTKLTFTVSARDADGDKLTYSASNLPPGATFNASTRLFSWTPSRSQIGTYSNISFRVTDGELTDSESITITVQQGNKAPIMGSISNQTVTAGSLLTFTVNASDANGDSLNYTASSLPSGAMFDTTTHKFSWTPSASQKGTYRNVRFLVNDGTTTVAKNITITVKAANQAPALNAISNKTVKAGSTLTFAVSGSDPNGDKLTYSATNMPKGATFNAATRTFTWKPTTSQKGTYDGVVFKVTDGSLSATRTISITVN